MTTNVFPTKAIKPRVQRNVFNTGLLIKSSQELNSSFSGRQFSGNTYSAKRKEHCCCAIRILFWKKIITLYINMNVKKWVIPYDSQSNNICNHQCVTLLTLVKHPRSSSIAFRLNCRLSLNWLIQEAQIMRCSE